MGKKNTYPALRAGTNRKKIIFIHGLSGSASGTWGDMHKVLSHSEELSSYAYACYTYPTCLINFPWKGKMPGIQEISEGFRSFVESNYDANDELVVVAHSLGGLIARHYLLEADKAKRNHQVVGLITYASPLNGSGLADLAKLFSWRHVHLRQLSRGTDFLNSLNSDWKVLEIESKIKFLALIAAGDAVVSAESSSPYISDNNVRVLIEYGHGNITKPVDEEDIRFIFLKRFILNGVESDVCVGGKVSGDILFDSYSLKEEQFYIKRKADSVVLDAAQGAHVWISGPPGVGKTASLRRLAEISKWKFKHIILDAYRGLSPFLLMKEVCSLLMTASGMEEDVLQSITSFHDLMRCMRRNIHQLINGDTLAVLIEEIPLSQGDEFKDFLDFAYQLALLSEAASSQGRIIWLFTSLINPREDIRPGQVKMLEKFQFVEFEYWHSGDMRNLVSLICGSVEYKLTEVELELVLNKCYGSPRFVKMLFRRTRSEVGARKGLLELIESVEMDLAR